MVVSFDVETTGLYPFSGCDMFAWSTCDPDGNVVVKRLDKGRRRRNLPALRSLLNGSTSVVGHNIKFDLAFAEKALRASVVKNLPIHDTMIQSHVVESDMPSRELKYLAWEFGGILRDDEKAVKAFVKQGGNYSHVPEPLMREYQQLDAERTMLLHLFFYPKIQENKKWLSCYNMEMDLIKTTLRMEQRGLQLNRYKAQSMRDRLLDQREETLEQIQNEVGERVNPDSDDELRWILFEKADLPVLELTEKAKQPKVDKIVIGRLAEMHPDNKILDLILRYRSWSGGASSMQNYLNLADDDGILHPNIRTCGARTGRESCSNPNLQNVQKSHGLLNPYPVAERSVFTPRPGFVNFHIDYAGQELRLLVHYSREQELIDAIHTGDDMHSMAAELFFGDRWRKAGPKERKVLRDAAKNANFAIPYGASGSKIAKILGLDRRTGEERLALYRRRWPRLAFLSKEIASECRRVGSIDTAFGRTIRVLRDKAYTGTNYLIQGTGAGMLKRAQIRIDQYLQDVTGDESRLLLPIHDEIVLEYPRKMLPYARDVMGGIRDVMIDFNEFDVPMEVEFEIVTTNWNKKKEWLLAA